MQTRCNIVDNKFCVKYIFVLKINNKKEKQNKKNVIIYTRHWGTKSLDKHAHLSSPGVKGPLPPVPQGVKAIEAPSPVDSQALCCPSL